MNKASLILLKPPWLSKVMKGIAELHPSVEKRAKPLELAYLQRLIQWLEQQQAHAAETEQRARWL